MLLPPIVLATTAYLVSDAQPRRYEATAVIVYQPTKAEELLEGDRSSVLADRDIKTEEQLLNSTAYQQRLSDRFGDDVDIEADALDTTDVIEVTVEAPSPGEAATVADAVVDDYIAQRRADIRADLAEAEATLLLIVEDLEVELDETDDALIDLKPAVVAPVDGEEITTTTVAPDTSARIRELERRQDTLAEELSVARRSLREVQTAAALTNGDVRSAGPAAGSSSPIAPRPERSATLAAMVGALLGLGLLWLRQTGDHRLRGTNDLLQGSGGLELAGRVAKPSDLPASGPVALLIDDVADQFRVLAGSSLPAGGSPMAVQIAGLSGGEGATYIAVNLAVTLAQGGWRVALVDADLEDGDIHAVLGVEAAPGTADVLDGDPLSVATQPCRVAPGLHVVARGSDSPRPTLLQSSLPKLVSALRSRFDMVIVDGPAVLERGDAAVLSRHVDATYLVAQVGRSTGPEAQLAVDVVAVGGGNATRLILTDTSRSLLRRAQPESIGVADEAAAVIDRSGSETTADGIDDSGNTPTVWRVANGGSRVNGNPDRANGVTPGHVRSPGIESDWTPSRPSDPDG